MMSSDNPCLPPSSCIITLNYIFLFQILTCEDEVFHEEVSKVVHHKCLLVDGVFLRHQWHTGVEAWLPTTSRGWANEQEASRSVEYLNDGLIHGEKGQRNADI